MSTPLAARARHTPEEIARILGRPAPTAEQARIISADLAPRLVVAGAGSGKTATMVDRVVWLVVNGFARPEEILGVTFTTKAAAELRQRMVSRLATLAEHGLRPPGEDPQAPELDPTVSTYHSYAKALVSEYGLRIGVERDAAQLGAAQSHQLAAQLVAHWEGPLPEQVPAASTLVTAVLQLSGECAEHLVDPADVAATCETELARLRALPNDHPKQLKKAEAARNAAVTKLEQKLLVARLAVRYQRLKQTMQVMDFGDLLLDAARLAREVPAVAREQRELYKVVLLDEFQDTSHAQMVLFSTLFGDGHSVMAVGDPKQSIYGFRGASEGQLFDFPAYFPAEDAAPSYLTAAWRNGTRILDAANAVAAPLGRPAPWAPGERRFPVPDLVPRPEPTPGQVLTGTWISEEEEAADLVRGIRERAEQARAEGREPATAAVLCRARAQLETVRAECERQGVPAEVLGLGGLLQTPEVVDMVATLRVLSDPSRADALMRLLAGARWRIGARDLMALNDWARFLARRRRQAVERGIAEDLTTPEGHVPGEEGLRAGRGEAPDPEQAEAQAREAVQELLRTGGGDETDGASLIEGIETLPGPAWTSATGRAMSPEARRRLERCARELEELRGYLGEDLTTLLHHIERLSLLDIELASHPGRSVHEARMHLDAFHQAAAQYCATAPRMAATLDAGTHPELFAPAGADPDAAEQATPQEHRYTVTSSAAGVTAFLAWLETAAREESGLPLPAGPAVPGAVQLLTVHGSKGLEWDEVHLFGMAEGIFPTDQREHWLNSLGALPWPLRGDRGHLPQWDTDQTGTTGLQESWTAFLEDNDERVVAEERRLAYVAITRARELVSIGSSRWTGTRAKPRVPSRFLADLPEESVRIVYEAAPLEAGAQNPQRSSVLVALWPFDPLTQPAVTRWEDVETLDGLSGTAQADAALDPGPVRSRRAEVERAAALVRQRIAQRTGGGAAEAADAPGEAPGESTPETLAWEEETELLLALRRTRARAAQRTEIPRHVSASLVVGLAEDPEAVLRAVRRPMPRRPSAQARVGTRFHEWLEHRYGAPAMLDLGERLVDPEEETPQELSALQEKFLASRWADRQPWAVELPLETSLGGITVRGRIDAVFRTPDPAPGEPEWELVDWKTGRVPTGRELADRSVQLAVYRLAFARLRDLDPATVRASFHYIAQNREITPEHLPGEEELSALLARLGHDPR